MNFHRFAALGLLLLLTHSALAADTRELRFPDLNDGRLVLSVDTHTHSVFSDGHVWPTVRVWEANKDRLDGMAITEHLEYQPYRKDIPHPDRNRAFELAAKKTKKGASAQTSCSYQALKSPGNTHPAT